MFEEDELEFNLYKTDLIMHLYDFISNFGGDTNTFHDIVYRIISIKDEDELMCLEFEINDDDEILESIFKKFKINRMKVKNDSQ